MLVNRARQNGDHRDRWSRKVIIFDGKFYLSFTRFCLLFDGKRVSVTETNILLLTICMILTIIRILISIKLRFELSLLLHLTPTLSAPLTFCKFAQKWGQFHLKLCYTKMTASTRRSFWYLMILTWNAVHNPLESIEGKVFQFYDFHKFSSVFSRT